jgi:PAS domain S-box-containing protein
MKDWYLNDSWPVNSFEIVYETRVGAHMNGEQKNKTALQVTSLFFIFSIIWIVATDTALNRFLPADFSQTLAQTLKGLLFVTAATIFVYGLSRRAFTRVALEARMDQANRTENLLKTVMANLGEAVILVAPPKRSIVGCNSAVKSMLGYSAEELVGKTTALIHEDETAFESFGTTSEAVLQKEGIFRCEYRLKHKDGHAVPVEITVVALHKDLGWHAGVVSIIRDLTSQKKAEHALRKSEEQYRLLAENTLDIIWEMSLDFVFTYVNPAIEKMTGYTPSEFAGTHLRESVGPGELKRLERIIREEIAKGPQGGGIILETCLRHKNGALIPIEVHARVIFENNAKPAAIQGTTRDISQRRALEAKLRQSMKLQAIGTFAGGIAHEINNPIMGISAYSELLADAENQSPEIREYCSEIQTQTERIHILIKDLLGYARAEEDMPVESVRLHNVVASTISLVRTVIRHDNIELSLRISKDLPPILCRRQQIQQVVMNLVTNARDALNVKYPDGDENKRILIAGETVDSPGKNFIRLIVEDTGPGIPENVRARIFEPFFTTKSEGTGTGLGMWIVHNVVHDHHGEIGIETRPGEFTRFNIDLPAAGDRNQSMKRD